MIEISGPPTQLHALVNNLSLHEGQLGYIMSQKGCKDITLNNEDNTTIEESHTGNYIQA